jgi:hypothetical protein
MEIPPPVMPARVVAQRRTPHLTKPKILPSLTELRALLPTTLTIPPWTPQLRLKKLLEEPILQVPCCWVGPKPLEDLHAG